MIFMTSVFGSIIHLETIGTDPGVELLCVALTAGFSVIAMVMCFSKISGSNLNPAISFALWLTGRLSNRKFVLYVCAQLLASVASMCIVFLTFSNPTVDMYKLVAVKPGDGEDLGRVFFTQVIGTFMLTYVAFTMGYEEAALEKEAQAKVKQVLPSKNVYICKKICIFYVVYTMFRCMPRMACTCFPRRRSPRPGSPPLQWGSSSSYRLCMAGPAAVR